MSERGSFDHPGRAELRGRAHGRGQVYQAFGDQYIFQAHAGHGGEGHTEVARTSVEETHERVTLLIRVLRLTEAEWRARCASLAMEARRARAEGRAEALAEVQEQLRQSELHVIKAQQMMREAQEERSKAETLLLWAEQEAARLRQAEKRKRQEEQAEADRRARTGDPDRDSEGFSLIMERAEAELASVRDELRALSEGVAERRQGLDWHVIKGEAASTHEADRELASELDGAVRVQGALPTDSPAHNEAPRPRTSVPQRPVSSTKAARPPVPGPPRRLRVALACMLYGALLCVPAVVVTSLRAGYGAHPGLWQAALFTIGVVVVGAALYIVVGFLFVGFLIAMLTRDSEDTAVGVGIVGVIAGVVVVVIVMAWTPLDWPGPAGAWGRSIASWVFGG